MPERKLLIRISEINVSNEDEFWAGGDAVVVQIEHVQAREILEVLDLFNVVLSKNQNSEVLDWWNDIDFSQLVH